MLAVESALTVCHALERILGLKESNPLTLLMHCLQRHQRLLCTAVMQGQAHRASSHDALAWGAALVASGASA